MRARATDVAWSVCLSVCLSAVYNREPCETGRTDQDAVCFGPCFRWRPGSPRPGEGPFWGGVVPQLKCIRLCKQQTPQMHGAADLSAGAAHHGDSAGSEWTRPDQCGGDANFRQNSLTTRCHLYSSIVSCALQIFMSAAWT